MDDYEQRFGGVGRLVSRAGLARLRELPEVRTCQDCWTLCRGFGQAMGEGGSLRSWSDLATRMRSH